MQLAAAAFPMLMRFGSGGFGSGYSAKLDSDDGSYGAVKVAGRKVRNTKLPMTSTFSQKWHLFVTDIAFEAVTKLMFVL